uniref:DNA polymerase lambda n=1 Tax=Kwoniella dejecticola CBS 10117 TaxID=1296121 RepID=A0A1A5ZZG9_9TREE|nr:uncharacterized protein I303_06763 [Kwoniella dejecticola CBS 10117]OBR83204.1 hypothetical protein I303_06763 [Kwoniella dejecticola CBS 10117]
MTHRSVFPRHGPKFWGILDGAEALEGLTEDQEEAIEYNRQLKKDIEWKETARSSLKPGSNGFVTVDAENDEKADESISIHPQHAIAPATTRSRTCEAPPNLNDSPADAPISSSPIVPFLPPSFHSSQLLQTSTPRGSTSTFPSMPTPSEVATPQLPDPTTSNEIQLGVNKHPTLLDTPEHIASPIDSPSTGASRRPAMFDSNGEGKGRRDDPATPVPIGKSTLSDIKSKKELQTISRHFDLLTKVLVKGQTAPKSNEKDKRAIGKALSVAAGLGGKVFEGLRFCLTSEVNQASKLKQRAEIITQLGGQAVLQPDTAITHVVYDAGRSASLLAQKLGIESLSELPEGTVCVKWDWVVQCKMVGKVLETTPWLSFPKTSFSRAVSTNAIKPTSRMFDITDQLRGTSVAITRKREPTASDSDTEESAKKRTRLGQTKSITLLSRVVEGIESTVKAGPSRIRSLADMDVSVATEHNLPSGPGWERASTNERDALDDMIDGVIEGSMEDQDISDNDHIEQVGVVAKGQATTNLGFKCSEKHDGKGYSGPNEWLARKFEELHGLYQGQVGKNSFAIRGYQRGIDYPITTGAQARAIPGIGQSLADRIDEFLSGAQGRAFYENTEQARCVALFKDVYGVGRQHANDLYRLGARSIDDLRTGKYSLTAGQMIGLQLYDDLKARIPRNECRDIFEIIRSEAQAIDDKLWVEIMGSYRRGQENSGDVDILITREGDNHANKRGIVMELVQRLKKKGLVTHDLGIPTDWTAPEAKWMGVGRLSTVHKHRRIDILSIPFENWGAALIYFTGKHPIFNRSIRLYARKKGYSLNQRGLYRGVLRDREGTKQTEGELIASHTEKDIFDALGLRWRHPHHRRP